MADRKCLHFHKTSFISEINTLQQGQEKSACLVYFRHSCCGLWSPPHYTAHINGFYRSYYNSKSYFCLGYNNNGLSSRTSFAIMFWGMQVRTYVSIYSESSLHEFCCTATAQTTLNKVPACTCLFHLVKPRPQVIKCRTGMCFITQMLHL